MNVLFRKLIIAGIFLLFIEVGFEPIISSNIKNINIFQDNFNKTYVADESTIKLSLSFNVPIVKEVNYFDKVYSSVILENVSNYGKPGLPYLPKKPVQILLPPDGVVKDFHIDGNLRKLDGTYYVEPAGGVLTHGCLITSNHVSINPNSYGSSEMFPGKPGEIVYNGFCRGFQLVIVDLYPVQYIPKNGELYYYSDLKIKIETEKDKVNDLFRGIPSDSEYIKSKIINPSMLNRYQKNSLNISDYYKYVIVTTSNLKHIFDILILYKSQFISSKIVTKEEIEKNSQFWDPFFNDTQCQIRNFIKYAYYNWGAEYVLIGGDVDKIPYRGFWVEAENGDGIIYNDTNIPSDLYYAALDGTWNDDNDEYWGEVGEADFFSEVLVGRAPVDNAWETARFVKKVILYETSSKPDSITVHQSRLDSWNNFPDSTTIPDACADLIPNNYTVHKLYQENEQVTKEKWIKCFNEDRLIIQHTGNGGSSLYYLNYLYDVPIMWENSDAFSLKNQFFPIQTSVACHSGDFSLNDCLAESYLLNPEGGLSACFFNSRYGFYSSTNASVYSGEFIIRQFYEIFKNSIENLSKINQFAKEYFASKAANDSAYRWCYYTINLLGDPETPILTKRQEDYGHHGIIWVNDDFNSSIPYWNDSCFAKVQDGIDAAEEHSIVTVCSGYYCENVCIRKEIELIGFPEEMWFGDDTGTPIIDGGGVGSVITLLTNFGTIQGLNIINSGKNDQDAGISWFSSSGISINNNNIYDCYTGINLFECEFAEIRNNNVKNNNKGIHIMDCNSNSLDGNNIQNNSYGIIIESPIINTIYGLVVIGIPKGENSIKYNNFENNTKWGIIIAYNKNNIVESYFNNNGKNGLKHATYINSNNNIWKIEMDKPNESYVVRGWIHIRNIWIPIKGISYYPP